MTAATQEEIRFMLELYNMTDGSLDAQISMYDIGDSLGFDKATITSMSQDLMIEELVELKTLSGGIGITQKAMQLLQNEGLIAGSKVQSVRLSTGPVINDQDREHIDVLLTEIKSETATARTEYPLVEELVIDIKTLETQLLSPRPKTYVFRAIFLSLIQLLSSAGANRTAEKLQQFVEE